MGVLENIVPYLTAGVACTAIYFLWLAKRNNLSCVFEWLDNFGKDAGDSKLKTIVYVILLFWCSFSIMPALVLEMVREKRK